MIQTVPQHGTPTMVPLALIDTRSQIRTRNGFEEESLRELAASIKARGILQPLVVTQPDAEGRHMLVIGERRLLAASLANLPEVPVIVRSGTPADLAADQAVENLQREDLHPLDVAEGLAALYEAHGRSWRKVAEAVGKSPAWVSKKRALTRLRPVARQVIELGWSADPEVLLCISNLEKLDTPRAEYMAELVRDGKASRDDVRRAWTQAQVRAMPAAVRAENQAQEDGDEQDEDQPQQQGSKGKAQDLKVPASLALWLFHALDGRRGSVTLPDGVDLDALRATVQAWHLKL
jgi:ParB family chromosome partitioning protein